MSDILLPKLFNDKLVKAPALRSALDLTIVNFRPWLKDSKLPFFQDYTDHGPSHIQEVLTTSAELITKDAKSVFSPLDTVVYILAVLLHDAAMHLSEAGFQSLIKGDANTQCIPGFDKKEKSWPMLWNEFLYSARRWDGKKLADVVGEKAANAIGGVIADPFEHYDNLQTADRRLIGEFIRQNHPRLAHEFAIFGVPGPSSDRLHIFDGDDGFNARLRDLAGIVARSHGLPVRKCLDYLKDRKYSQWEPDVHSVYLMGLLRLADYIQIQASRAISPRYHYKHIDSPLSQLEHRTHQCIQQAYIMKDDDPETLRIMAKPTDVFVYLRLSEWIAGIQQELDSSWAVLGEEYGSKANLRRLGYVIRRVRSNIEDVDDLARHVDFEPRLVEISVARSELLHLLIKPLYGNKPEVGIRELIQNAVDAVRERRLLQEKGFDDADLLDQEGDVEVWLGDPLEDGTSYITISDRGAGMNADTICNYFLRVGSSYRQSEHWKKQFEHDGSGSSQKSLVIRSGRFGVGMLAAFLLGDEIDVSTRHIGSTTGLRFSTRIDSGPIAIKHDHTLKVGTTIRVRVAAETRKNLTSDFGDINSMTDFKWDWYCFNDPKVLRLKGGKRMLLTQQVSIPDSRGATLKGWIAINSPCFEAIHIDISFTNERILICNGIKIKSMSAGRFPDSRWHFGLFRPELQLKTPMVSIIDSDANLNLTLQRESLQDNAVPFAEVGYDALLKNLLAELIVKSPDSAVDFMKLRCLLDLLVRGRNSLGEVFWMHTPAGVALSGMAVMEKMKINSILRTNLVEVLVFAFDEPRTIASYFDNSYGAVIPCFDGAIFAPSGEQERQRQQIIDLARILVEGHHTFLRGSRLVVEESVGRKVLSLLEKESRVNPLPLHSQLSLSIEWTGRGWISLVCGDKFVTKIFRDKLPSLPNYVLNLKRCDPFLLETIVDSAKIDAGESHLQDRWDEIIQYPVVPYDINERKSTLAHAYEKLAAFIEHKA